MYGSRFVSGWCGYFLAGKTAPAGKIIVFDDSKVYGYGRKPKYYRWTTPIEHQLFAADKIGRAMKFTGSAGSTPGFEVKHNWTKDVPLFARAMVLAGRTLFVAGPPDRVDEDQAFRQIDDPKTKQSLADQAAAHEGRRGALLRAVSAADGSDLAQYELTARPSLTAWLPPLDGCT